MYHGTVGTCRGAEDSLLEEVRGVGAETRRHTNVVDADEPAPSEGDVRMVAMAGGHWSEPQGLCK